MATPLRQSPVSSVPVSRSEGMKRRKEEGRSGEEPSFFKEARVPCVVDRGVSARQREKKAGVRRGGFAFSAGRARRPPKKDRIQRRRGRRCRDPDKSETIRGAETSAPKRRGKSRAREDRNSPPARMTEAGKRSLTVRGRGTRGVRISRTGLNGRGARSRGSQGRGSPPLRAPASSGSGRWHRGPQA